jgi:hypothetical protein
MLRIFYTEKIQRLRPGLNPRTREPEASMGTTRPPKPSIWSVYYRNILQYKFTAAETSNVTNTIGHVRDEFTAVFLNFIKNLGIRNKTGPEDSSLF